MTEPGGHNTWQSIAGPGTRQLHSGGLYCQAWGTYPHQLYSLHRQVDMGNQGWELAHLMSKNERMSNLLKKMSDSLIRSFLVSEMSDSLTSFISSERPEQIAHGRSFPLSHLSDSLTFAHLS